MRILLYLVMGIIMSIPAVACLPTMCCTDESIWDYIYSHEDRWSQDSSASYGSSSGISKYSLGIYTMDNRSFYEDDGALFEYLNNTYVKLEDYNHLRYILGQWQSQYYALSMRVAALEAK